MKSKLINDSYQRTFALIFDYGDNVMEQLKDFALDNHLKASQFTAIGAFAEAELGYFDFSIKDYKRIPVPEQVEVLSLIGDISLDKEEPKVHAHVVLGRSDGSTVGGHLLKAKVHPTLEVILNESPGYLERQYDKESHLPLIKI